MTLSTIPNNLKRVAIAGGTGALGQNLTEEFLKIEGIKLKVLTRKSTGEVSNPQLKEKFIKRGAEVVEVDYNNQDELNAALKEIDVVVSALNSLDFVKINLVLLNAAVKNNVNLFIPSEFFSKLEGTNNPFTAPKAEIRKHLEKSGLNYIYYNCGFFYEHITSELFGIDVINNKAKIVGSGNTKLNITRIRDVASFIAQTYHFPEVKNAHVNISSQVTTMNEIVKQIGEVGQKPLEIEYIDLKEIEKLIVEKAEDIYYLLFAHCGRDIELGNVYIEKDSNYLLPGFKFESLKEYIRQTYFN
ncbi:NAD(P)-binding protein [Neoconidiobolus thromboides FSU 785]|nr:NAD(P)-binding protein [Neoconidiobolus thromboides FSU 785]